MPTLIQGIKPAGIPEKKGQIHRFWVNRGDWCHVCGKRQERLASADTYENAEHALKSPNDPQMKKHIRICSDCLGEMAEAAKTAKWD